MSRSQQLLKIQVSENQTVSGLLNAPNSSRALMILAHGAGAGMRHKFMEDLAQILSSRDIATIRYQFPYMENGSKRPDSPKIAIHTIAAALEAARKLNLGLPIYAGGKSFGCRMTTAAAAQGFLAGVEGIVCFGFPLHPAGKLSSDRAKHLQDVPFPILFLQGTRDNLADLAMMKNVVGRLKSDRKLITVEGADHGFAVLKSSGRSDRDVLEYLGDATADFIK